VETAHEKKPKDNSHSPSQIEYLLKMLSQTAKLMAESPANTATTAGLRRTEAAPVLSMASSSLKDLARRLQAVPKGEKAGRDYCRQLAWSHAMKQRTMTGREKLKTDMATAAGEKT
jgi:hypothetical protein